MSEPIFVENNIRRNPFVNMKIRDNSILNQIDGRSPCGKCGKSRKFFCYTCCLPVDALKKKIPVVELPVKIDIIKHKSEIDGKSSAVHATILAPNDVRIFTYPDIPDYSKEEKVVLIFPCTKSITVNQLFNANIKVKSEGYFGLPKGYNVGTLLKKRLEEETAAEQLKSDENILKKCTISDLPVLRAVFIDSTWNQSRGIYKDERICSLKSIALQNRISQFWRHQKGSPRWYLATIEAVHQFLLEVHVNAWGLSKNYRGLDNLGICDTFFENSKNLNNKSADDGPYSPYSGQYDNLLFFFSHMYDLIHIYYDHNELKSYKRPF